MLILFFSVNLWDAFFCEILSLVRSFLLWCTKIFLLREFQHEPISCEISTTISMNTRSFFGWDWAFQLKQSLDNANYHSRRWQRHCVAKGPQNLWLVFLNWQKKRFENSDKRHWPFNSVHHNGIMGTENKSGHILHLTCHLYHLCSLCFVHGEK